FRRPWQPWQGQQQQQGYQPKVPAYQATGHDDVGERSSKDPAPDDNADMSATSVDESLHQDEFIYSGQDDYGNDYYYNEANDDQGTEFINFVDAAIEAKCRNCNESFPSKTKLHKHLRSVCKHKTSKVLSVDAHPAEEAPPPSHPPIVESDARNDETGSGFAFRGWDYVKLDVRLEPE
ncbi:MAG: hypothetical protein LQ350_008708, partial [Teloschistes chrysophthalmus]